MSPEHKEISEEQLRRRRINLYKKIIIGIVITLILLPTLLCIILFCKVNKLSDKLDDIKTAMDATEKETTDKVMESEPNSGNNKKPAVNSADMPSKGSADKETDSVVKELSDSEKIDNALAEGRKVVYLTYDDGPSANTEKLLDVLDQYGIKATFFVIKTPEYDEYVKKLLQEAIHWQCIQPLMITAMYTRVMIVLRRRLMSLAIILRNLPVLLLLHSDFREVQVTSRQHFPSRLL